MENKRFEEIFQEKCEKGWNENAIIRDNETGILYFIRTSSRASIAITPLLGSDGEVQVDNKDSYDPEPSELDEEEEDLLRKIRGF